MTDIQDARGALDRVLELTVLLGDDMARDLARRGLTGSRAHLVWELHRRGPSTQQTLAEALGVTPRAITGLVDALTDGGFVTREPHPRDRRATLVTFTRQGSLAAKALERDHIELAGKLFGDLSASTFRGFTRELPEPLHGRATWREGALMFRRAFPDLHAEIEDIFRSGDRVAVRLRMRGTHEGDYLGIPATGRAVSYVSHEFYRIENGLIAEEWICSDTASLFRQIG